MFEKFTVATSLNDKKLNAIPENKQEYKISLLLSIHICVYVMYLHINYVTCTLYVKKNYMRCIIHIMCVHIRHKLYDLHLLYDQYFLNFIIRNVVILIPVIK